MYKKVSKIEIISFGLMLFSIFFGAGNLIFPPALGQAAGSNMFSAMSGFLITGVGLPLLGVLAIGLAGGNYTQMIENRVHRYFMLAMLVILNLTIGPLFAIPRTGAVSFEVGFRPFLSPEYDAIGQFVYTFIFFGLTYFLALNPSKLVDWVGKLLTPILLFFIALLVLQGIAAPLGPLESPTEAYYHAPFLQGVQSGYLTMDLLAFIAIGSIVVNSMRDKGIHKPADITKYCTIAGLISATLMGLVYVSLAYLGATSVEILGQSENGGIILASVANLYFGHMGNVILAIIISFACLTTSCGLSASCATFFSGLFYKKITYKQCLTAFVLFSMAASNIGLTSLINLSVPFLVGIYPMVIVLVLLSMSENLFGKRREVYWGSLGLTFIFSIFDGMQAANIHFDFIHRLCTEFLPLYTFNFGWVVPSIVGAVLGYIISFFRK